MNENSDNVLAGGETMGEPVPALANFEQETSPQFVEVVRKKIYRRVAVSQFLGLSWNFPQMLLLEFIEMLGAVFGAKPDAGRNK
jgi:hypothetical protein